jgi:ribulose-phosphate 3-epimerase
MNKTEGNTMDIYPSILTDSLITLREQLSLVKLLPDIEIVQVDVIDGEFTDNLTLSPIDLISTDFEQIRIDFHLMVNEPIEYVYECKQVDNVRSVIGQIERMSSQEEFISEALELNILPGLSVDLYTPVESIEERSWEKLSIVQIMGNKAGIQGQSLKGEIVLKKIREVAEMKKKLDLPNLEILLDIGVTLDNVHTLVEAGATAVTPGSLLWKSDDIEKTVNQLRIKSGE